MELSPGHGRRRWAAGARRRGRAQRGAIAVWTAVGLPAFIVAIGIGVDLSGHTRATQEARAVAAEAARSGGQQLSLTSGSLAPVQVDGHRAAEQFARDAGFDADVRIDAAGITVTVRGEYATSFLGIMGIWDLDVEASATAGITARTGS